MTAAELYELVKPLIGTEWEPDGLTFLDGCWKHDGIYVLGGCLEAPDLPVPAARAMWEAKLMDKLWTDNTTAVSITKTGTDSWGVTRTWFAGRNIHDASGGIDPLGTGPTRLHALVAAAKAVRGGGT